MARMSLNEAATRGRVDIAKVAALTEDDIARFNADDGFDPNDTLRGLRPIASPAEIRERSGLTQVEMAARLTVPVKTWRNWEQGRVALEPATRALLALVADDPERAFRILDSDYHKPAPHPGPEEIARQPRGQSVNRKIEAEAAESVSIARRRMPR